MHTHTHGSKAIREKLVTIPAISYKLPTQNASSLHNRLFHFLLLFFLLICFLLATRAVSLFSSARHTRASFTPSQLRTPFLSRPGDTGKMSAHHANIKGPKGEDIQVPVGLWIDGQLVSSSQNRTFETISAANGKTLATLQEGNDADVDKAVIAAQKVSDGDLNVHYIFHPAEKYHSNIKRLTPFAGFPKVERDPRLGERPLNEQAGRSH